MTTSIFSHLEECLQKQIPAALCTVVDAKGSSPGRPGAKMLVKEDGSIIGTVGGGAIEKKIIEVALTTLKSKKCNLLNYNLNKDLNMSCGGAMSVFIEPQVFATPLVIFGAGHIGTSLARLATESGFKVTLADYREEWINQSFPESVEILFDDMVETAKTLSIHPSTFLVVVSHGHALDEEICLHLIKKPYSYLGVIGSRRKRVTFKKNLITKGFDEQKINQIRMPVGLNIGANTPAQIAVSILAEIIAVEAGVEPSRFDRK